MALEEPPGSQAAACWPPLRPIVFTLYANTPPVNVKCKILALVLRRRRTRWGWVADRRENLNQSNRLSRTQTMLMDALSRYRGKGHQKVTVEHVHAGGQAIVGAAEHGGGVSGGNQGQPQAKQLAHAPEPLELSAFCVVSVGHAPRGQQCVERPLWNKPSPLPSYLNGREADIGRCQPKLVS